MTWHGPQFRTRFLGQRPLVQRPLGHCPCGSRPILGFAFAMFLAFAVWPLVPSRLVAQEDAKAADPAPAATKADQPPAADAPAVDVPAVDVPAGDVPAGDVPAGDAPTGTTTEAKPAEEKSAEEKSADSSAEKKDPPATEGEAKADGASKTEGADTNSEVGVDDVLKFRQQKVAAEMAELEQRMFRLAEGLKQLEPDNASRLMLGLKFSRDELILHEMKELQAMLDKLQLGDALTKEKAIVDKLKQLQELLLTSDLEFQLRLARLRQIREILRRLGTAIKEEGREKNWSRDAQKIADELAALLNNMKTLQEIIARQKSHNAQGTELSKVDPPSDKELESLGTLSTEQTTTQTSTKELQASVSKSGTPSPNLETAAGHMGTATEKLAAKSAKEALPEQESALKALEDELKNMDEKAKDLENKLAEAEFKAMQRDQMDNQKFTTGISELVKALGQAGTGAMQHLTKADASMGGASGALGSKQAGDAGDQQQSAEKSLNDAKEELEEQAEKLLDELRPEIRRRVIEGLTFMLEKQISVRESTELLGPKVAQGVTAARDAVQGLAPSERKIVEMGDELTALVEETEFGIALPAALKMVVEQMAAVEGSLAEGDASEPVVVAEKQIEEDLQSLLKAIRQLPPTKPPSGKGRKGTPQERERELNRLAAELKMIRLLQLRVNRDTTKVDKNRPMEGDVPVEVRGEIEVVTDHQDDVRDATERLSIERGDELEGGSQ